MRILDDKTDYSGEHVTVEPATDKDIEQYGKYADNLGLIGIISLIERIRELKKSTQAVLGSRV